MEYKNKGIQNASGKRNRRRPLVPHGNTNSD